MRTTLDVDDDVLSAVKSLAEAQKTTAGKVISELARKALTPSNEGAGHPARNGFVLLPAKKDGQPVTMEMINRLRDED
jgi:hypothetical protein